MLKKYLQIMDNFNLVEAHIGIFIMIKHLTLDFIKTKDNDIRCEIMNIINENNYRWEFNKTLNNVLIKNPQEFLDLIYFYGYLKGWNVKDERKITEEEIIQTELSMKEIFDDDGNLIDYSHIDRFLEYKKLLI